MSERVTEVTPITEDSPEDGPDLSRFLAKHHVALIVIDGPRRGAEYPVRREQLVIGRSRKADLVFDEDTLSRRHAAIRYLDGRFVLEDLESANGSRHNGRSAYSAELAHGDEIQLGRIRMKLVIEARDPDPSTLVIDAD